MCCAYSSGGSRALRQHSSILRTLRIEVSFLQSDRGSIRTPLLSPCLVAKYQIPNFFPAPAWKLKFRRNKKRIATAICKWRDESNEPN